MGLFHESQHNTPQLLFYLYDISSTPRIDTSDDNDIYPFRVARNCANSSESVRPLGDPQSTRTVASEHSEAISSECPTIIKT
jgi:hypothetical protein